MYLKDIEFSLWADFIERDFLQTQFKELVDQGVVNGATSNPAIFKNAFLKSKAYEDQKASLNLKGKELYEELACTDIKKAANILKPLYDSNDDGFVSIEVDPFLCDDTQATIDEALRLYEKIGMENVMIKIPATNAGYKAMTYLLKNNIHVNATLVFSVAQANKCIQAYEEANSNKNMVISVFVSRFDRLLDDMLPRDLQGLAGGLNAAKIYNIIESKKYPKLKTLFASTGVKDKTKYDEDYYISGLLAPHSVNTAPIDTIKAFIKSNQTKPALPKTDNEITRFFAILSDMKIDFQSVCDELLEDGLLQFKDAFKDIINSLN